MHLATCRIVFRLHGNNSLKGKRQVAHSLIARVKKEFNVSIAEVDTQDLHQTLIIGIACVSNNSRHANEIIDNTLRYVQRIHLDAEVVNVSREHFYGD